MNNQLLDAVRNNDLLTTQQLVLNGADVNCRNCLGLTPLWFAKSVEIAQFLVLNGADVNYRNNNGSTLLHCVQSLEIAQLLVVNGADVNCRNNFGDTPLHLVEYVKMAQLLVLNGADVNCQNNDGYTPLHYINFVITNFFVANCANFNYLNSKGNRPGHMCASIHDYYICIKNIKILLEYGADMHIKNNVGISAYDCAIQSNINELIELFEQYNTISNGLDIKEPCVE